MKVEKAGNFEKVLEGVLSKIDKLAAWHLDYLKEKCTGTWLTAIPNNIYMILSYRQLSPEMNFVIDTGCIF